MGCKLPSGVQPKQPCQLKVNGRVETSAHHRAKRSGIMIKKMFFFLILISSAQFNLAHACVDPGEPEPPPGCFPIQAEYAMDIASYYASVSESTTTGIIAGMANNGFTYVGAANSYKCDFGGPLFNAAQFCVYGRILSFYNSVSNLNAYVCTVNSNGPSVGVDVICTPNRIAGDTRDPAPRTGSGVNFAVSTPGIIAGGRGIYLEATAISAGISVKTTIGNSN